MPRTGGRTTRNMPRPSGIPQGSPGGMGATATQKAGVAGGGLNGPTGYLWLLVAIEVMLMGWLRHAHRLHHGG
jgi:hypothetical protein